MSERTQNPIVLIEGLPGTGKTTLVQRLAAHWGVEKCTGFTTTEIREKEKRSGFCWQDFHGHIGLLADLRPGSPRIGKYRVDLQSFEGLLSRILPVSAGKILIIDEVGKMECLSKRFRETLPAFEKLSSPRIFTVPARGTPFIEEFKTRNRKSLVRLDRQNRDEIFERLSQNFAHFAEK